MSVHMKPFDASVSSSTEDAWSEALDPTATFTPVTIYPGASATVHVTITPSGPPGTVVSGNVYVDDFTSSVPPYGQASGDELAAIPYAYTVK